MATASHLHLMSDAEPGLIRRDPVGTEPRREQALARLVSLPETTYIRVGNDEYRKSSGSYGLSTLEDRHVRIEGDRIALSFRGKGGKDQRVEVAERRLASPTAGRRAG